MQGNNPHFVVALPTEHYMEVRLCHQHATFPLAWRKSSPGRWPSHPEHSSEVTPQCFFREKKATPTTYALNPSPPHTVTYQFLPDFFRLSSGASSFSSSSLSISAGVLPLLSDLEGSGWTSATVCVTDAGCMPGGKSPLATRRPLAVWDVWPLAAFSSADAGLCISWGTAER